MKECVFCQIVAKTKPAHIIYEDKNFLGFLDHNPYADGHVILIPKKHYRWVWQIQEPGLNQAAGKICQALIKTLPIATVSYLSLGWMIDHAHLHLIPRQKGDGLISENSLIRQHFPDEKLKETAEKIKEKIG